MKISTRFLLLSLAAIAAMQTKAQTTSATTSDYPYLNNGIPTLYVNTNSGADPADKTTYLPCTIRYVDGATTTTYTLTEAKGGGIRGRGNTTWKEAQKRPWRIKFDNKKTKFLGSDFAEAKSWTLLANAFDKSLMRNALTYYLGKFVGLPFCPSARFVDLVMNGTYRGTYQISDQMEVNEKRVNVDSKTGWMFEYGNAEDKVDAPKVSIDVDGSNYGYVQVKNPEFTNDDFTTNQDLADQISTYLKTTLADSLKTTNTGYTYIDPNHGYRSMVDTASLINWYIATEITANWDGFYSIYSSRQVNGPLFVGPMWDEDLAYGNHKDTYNRSDFTKLDFYTNLLTDENPTTTAGPRKLQPVIAHLYDDPWFANAVCMRLNKLITDGIQTNLENKIDSMKTLLTSSAAANFNKWPINTVDPGYAHIINRYSWADYVKALRDFIGTRLTTIQNLIKTKNKNNRYLDENIAKYEFKANETKGVNVIIRRTAKAGMWNTVCFPFSMDKTLVEYMFGSGTVVEKFDNVTTDNTTGSITLNFITTNSAITAGVPYLVRPTRDVTVPYAFINGEDGLYIDNNGLSESPKTESQTDADGKEYKFVGIFSPTDLTADGNAGTKLFVGTNNTLLTPSATSGKLKGYRAYFVIPSTNAGAKMLMSFDDVVDGIHTVNADGTSTSKIYNINGQYVGTSKEGLAKGIYIVNGKKVVIK